MMPITEVQIKMETPTRGATNRVATNSMVITQKLLMKTSA
jgi:hypothetical protein